MSVVVTAKFIARGQAFRGGWCARQFEILGFIGKPPPGWRQACIGRVLSDSEAAEFLALSGKREASM